MVAKVIANIELDVETIIRATANSLGCSVSGVIMDDILEYINNGMTYLKNNDARGVEPASDGWSIDGFDEKTYEEIERILNEMQESL